MKTATAETIEERASGIDLYARHVNPKWVGVLDLLGMNVPYASCRNTELRTEDGRTILDFLSGYCVYNMGHNHEAIIGAIEDEMRRHGPTMLQSHVPALAGELAARLCSLAGGGLTKVFFTSSGSEGIETVIKFARARTKRDGILYCHGAFHGLTTGALSLMGSPWWREGFGPLLPGTEAVPFGDLKALAEKLSTGSFAALVLEPLQAEAGIVLPPPGYLECAAHLCRKSGTLFVLDEVQTGLHRAGPFLAAHRFGVEPDMVVIAKALSGGLIPCGAVLMTEAIHRSVYSSLSRSFIHASTFGENALAMRAGLATLDVLRDESLGEASEASGRWLRDALASRLARFEMIEEVRGLGLLNGIVFRKPRGLRLRAVFEAFSRIHSGMFGQMVVSELFRKERVLTQMCGNNHLVLKVAPPLTVSREQMERFVQSVERIVEGIHSGLSFWTGSLSMVKRAAAI